MRISRLFCPTPLEQDLQVCLDEKSSHYLARVLRAKVGQEVELFNGNGGSWICIIETITKKSLGVRAITFISGDKESKLETHLGIALSKGDKMDWIVQKATELGVNSITPLYSQQSDVRLKSERANKKQQHWQQIAISACEQCQRNKVPQINPCEDINSWISTRHEEIKFVLHHRHQGLRLHELEAQSAALLIGPEGGLSEAEIQRAIAQGFSALTIGPRVLRTETAPIVALSLLQQAWGDFDI